MANPETLPCKDQTRRGCSPSDVSFWSAVYLLGFANKLLPTMVLSLTVLYSTPGDRSAKKDTILSYGPYSTFYHAGSGGGSSLGESWSKVPDISSNRVVVVKYAEMR